MSYCPILQLLQSRETWAPFLESPTKYAGPGLPKTRGPEKNKTKKKHAQRQMTMKF